MLVLIRISQDVAEVCSSEVIAKVDLPDHELDFDKKTLQACECLGVVGAGRTSSTSAIESFFFCLFCLDFCAFFFFFLPRLAAP